jgi:hypothetical protein
MSVTVDQDFLDKIAEAAKLDPTFVTDEYNRILETIPEGPKQIDAAIYQLTTSLKAHKKSNAIPCEGVILGFTQPFDWQTGPKNKQLKKLKELMEQSEATIPEQWMIDRLIASGDAAPESVEGSAIIWLDNVQKFKSGKDNPNFGKPWKPAEQTAIMNLYGVAMPSIEVNNQSWPMKPFNITISNSEWFKSQGRKLSLTKNLQAFKQFRSKLIFYPDDSDATHNAFNISTLTDFEYFDTIDVMAFARKFIPERVVSLSDIESHYAKFGDREFCVVEAGIQNMRMNVSPIGMRTFYVDDPYMNPLEMFSDNGIAPDTRVDVPEAIPIDFARGTRAVFIATVKYREVNEKNNDGKWVPVIEPDGSKKLEAYLQADAIYPIPEYTIKAQESEELSGETTSPEGGW